MKDKDILISSKRVDGMQILNNKFPSLTKRQLNEVYAIADHKQLTFGDIQHIHIMKPNAKIGESFEIVITKLSDHAEKPY